MWQRLDATKDNTYGQHARAQYRRPWIWRLTVVICVIVIIAIVVPVAIIMSRRNRSTPFVPKANVIVPLYVYPAPNAWSPLYNAVSTKTSLNFTVVINPNNGPGTTSLPDENYITAIRKLNSYPNVQLLGYVPLGYGSNGINGVRQQVQQYSNWTGSGLAINGIFFDESPHVYSDSNAAYIAQARGSVDNATAIKSKTIVFNAGTIPEEGLFTSKQDIVIAFEESYSTFENNLSKLASLETKREQTGIIVHSVPSSASIKDLVNDMSEHADYVFATELTVHDNGNPYEAFGNIWPTFIANMPE